MTELTKGERTKKKLVDATATLLRKQGYHATGLSDIVEESGAPRGSLYFYFPDGKDELACEALAASGIEWRARVEAAVAHTKDIPSSIDAVIALLVDDLEASGWQNGCPVAAVALESPSKKVRDAVAEHYATWQATVADRIASYGLPKPVASQLATVAIASIEGALLLAKVHRSREPLVTVGAALRMMVSTLPKPRKK